MTGDYKRYFKISSFKFLRLAIKLENIQKYYLTKLLIKNRINLGKLKKHHCYLMPLNDNLELQNNFIAKTSGGRRIKLNKKFNFSELTHILELIEPDDLKKSKCEIFYMYKYKNGSLKAQGFIYKFENIKGLYFFSKKNFNHYLKLQIIEMYNLVSQITFENKEELLDKFEDLLISKYQYL